MINIINYHKQQIHYALLTPIDMAYILPFHGRVIVVLLGYTRDSSTGLSGHERMF